jgi:hypothetical protein
MKRIFSPASTILFLLALVATGLVLQTGAKAKPPSDTPVTTTIDGLGVNTLPTFRIQSDQLGAYRNSSSLSSIIQGIGDWELDMINFNSSPQRKALIDLRDPVPGSGPGGTAPVAPFAYQLVRARFISKCTQNGIDMRTMQPGNLYPCPLAVAFDDAGGVRYRLAANPSNFSETNWVQVTCVATDTNAKCNQWKIEPSVTQLNGERKNVAKLLKVATKPHQTDQDMGDFYLSFTIHVTNP